MKQRATTQHLARLGAALLTLCLSAAPAVSAAAQTPDEYVREVSRAHAEAREAIARGKSEPQAKNEIILNATYMIAGAGQTLRKVELFFRPLDRDENGYAKPPVLYLVRESFNVAAREFYREYLYDAEGEPLFFFSRHDTFDQGKVEQRCYYRNRQTVSAAPEGDGAAHLPRFDRYKALVRDYMALQQETK